MSALKARVTNGRIVLDEPTTLPEGVVGDDLDEADRCDGWWREQPSSSDGESPAAGT